MPMKKDGKMDGKKMRATNQTQEMEKFWETIPEEARDELTRLAQDSDSEEEFLRTVFVGDCPSCGSEETAMPKGADGEEDLSVGVCNACGYLWCLECDRELTPGTSCGHWQICENCEEMDEESGLCATSPDQCDVIQAWLTEKGS
jgi:hypothetical protein